MHVMFVTEQLDWGTVFMTQVICVGMNMSTSKVHNTFNTLCG